MKLFRIESLSGREMVTQRSRYFWDLTARKRRSLIFKYTLSGRGQMVHRGEAFDVHPGACLLMFAGEDTQYFYPSNAEEPWEFCWINLSGGSGEFDAVRDRVGPLVRLDPQGRTLGAFFEICDLFYRRRFEDRYHESAVLYRFCMTLQRELSRPGARISAVDAARDYLADHHRSYINVKEVAEHFEMSREHFIRVFRERHKVTPGRFLRDQRVRTAKDMLEHTDFPVAEIASLCGVGSASAFCRMFKESCGVTPLAWRSRR